jgi:hypothetical protein
VLVAGVALGTQADSTHVVEAQPTSSGTREKTTERDIDPKADELLREMSSDLGQMKAFRFDASHVMEVVTEDGQMLQGLAQADVTVQRPNKLYSDRMGPLGGATLYYDGNNLTVYGKRDNLYATVPAPETLDETIDFARAALSIDAPGADLLYSDPYSVLTEDVVSGRYLGKESVGNRVCHHLAFRGNDTDWQIWIEDGPRALPCRFVITSKNEPGQPDYTVTTSNWREQRSIEPATFAFTPPRGATKVDFVQVADDARKHKSSK